MPDTVGAQLPFGNGAVDPWPTASGRRESEYAGNIRVTVEANCIESRTGIVRSGSRNNCERNMCRRAVRCSKRVNTRVQRIDA